jgi:putative hydrolase of the HAD superfamily
VTQAIPIDWQNIQTVFLDMDGTLLDLHFDNHFWLEHMPKRYAEKHDITVEQASHALSQKTKAIEGS